MTNKVKITEVMRGFHPGYLRLSEDTLHMEYGPYMILANGEKRFTSKTNQFRYFLDPEFFLNNFTVGQHFRTLSETIPSMNFNKFVIIENYNA